MEILKKKISYAVGQVLNDYLLKYGRHVESVPEIYRDLSRFSGTAPYQSPAGAETLWHSVMFPPGEMAELRPKLTRIYASLKMGGGAEVAQHLDVERIDFGEFGNSRPFRITSSRLMPRGFTGWNLSTFSRRRALTTWLMETH